MPQAFYGRLTGFGLEEEPGTPVNPAYALSLREFYPGGALRNVSTPGITDLPGGEFKVTLNK